ncbi:diguanylate cyclase [Rhodanobacter denitrificans]|uniref:GGDEF domain-containing protein n=1 Tax=Rhodanobacter denitrificans TaxID=666685 RepID=UPI001F28B9E3|nr:GGDEF domain-containing protein [Rhodanobacter denitrificans]UJM99132.1 diguanylate cyclase [Rhodanobacter denitrificans]
MLLLAATPCAFAAPPPAHDAAAFDLLVRQLDNGDIPLNSQAAARQALDRLGALLPPGDAYRQRRYDYLYCFLAFDNDVKGGYAYAGRGTEQAQQAGDLEAESNFRICRGLYQSKLTTERDALPDYEAGIRLARRLENPRLIADALTWRGSAQSLLGEQAKALFDFLEAQRLYETVGNTTAAQSNLISIATIYRRLGEYDKAGEYLRQSMQSAQRKGDKQEQMVVDMQLGFLATERGDPVGAVAPLQRALALAHETGSRQSVGSALLALAESSNARERYAEALQQVEAAAKEFQAVADQSNAGMLALQSAKAHAGLGQHELAAREFDLAEASVRNSRNMRYLAELYDARSRNQEALGKPAAALADLRLKMEADAALARMAKTQLTTLMSYQFDTERRELENRKLAADKALKEQQLATLERVRGWQWLAILLAGLLLLMLWLAWRQLRQSRRLHRLALTDALTGISNRRHIEHTLHGAVEHARRGQRELAVIMLDIDHFKRVNDSHGHPAGDQALEQLVHACLGALRQHDRLGRLGGEEFLVVLPDTDLEGGLQVAERLRACVAAARPLVNGVELQLSISLGVAQLRPAESGAASLVRRADAALYHAKDNGRNRVEAAP